MLSRLNAGWTAVTPLQAGPDGLIPRGTRVEVFAEIFRVFLILGTLVGVVVLAYMLYNAYVYRHREGQDDGDVDRPTLGELPTSGGGGRKLFLSFSLSTIIVVSLIVWTYGTLLYVEDNPEIEGGNAVDIEVVGYQFGWQFVYPNGHTVDGELRVPADRPVRLRVTSRDVFHNFGIPELRVKTDAVPGHTTDAWFVAEETGEYEAQCFELCGSGHSFMTADVIVMEQGAYQNWYGNTNNSSNDANTTTTEA